MNKTYLHANSSGLPQYGTKTHNGPSSQNISVDYCCEITESSEIDVASSAIRQGRLGSSNLFSATCAWIIRATGALHGSGTSVIRATSGSGSSSGSPAASDCWKVGFPSAQPKLSLGSANLYILKFISCTSSPLSGVVDV